MRERNKLGSISTLCDDALEPHAAGVLKCERAVPVQVF
jgi:hypothetical protein